jgi:hypothetical protein
MSYSEPAVYGLHWGWASSVVQPGRANISDKRPALEHVISYHRQQKEPPDHFWFFAARPFGIGWGWFLSGMTKLCPAPRRYLLADAPGLGILFVPEVP